MYNSVYFYERERRRFPRESKTGLISVFYYSASRSFEGKIFNISEGGMSFATDLPLNPLAPVDTKVEQSLELTPNKRYSGKVIWKEKIDDLNTGIYRYGLKFAGSST